jgi:hypothetical protein
MQVLLGLVLWMVIMVCRVMIGFVVVLPATQKLLSVAESKSCSFCKSYPWGRSLHDK